MFGPIAAFEYRYQLRNPVFWVAGGFFFLIAFASITTDGVQIGDTANVHLNSPYAITMRLLILQLFFMFVSTAFVANVVVRDDETRFGPILRGTGVGKFSYLFGRYVGALGAAATAFALVPLALWLGSLMPWLDPDKLGPSRLDIYGWAYLITLPTLFVTSAMFFAVATATRSMMATYVFVVALLMVYLIGNVLASRLDLKEIIAAIDPFALRPFALSTRYWTADERNSRLLALSGPLLANRLIWSGVAVALLALAWRIFRFDAAGARKAKAERASAAPAAAPAAAPPLAQPRFDGRTALAQFWACTRLDVGQVVRSPAFFILLALGAFNGGAGAWFSAGFDDAALYPVTRSMIVALQGGFAFVPLLVAIYYSGDLVWRERDRRTEGMIEVAPIPDWAFVVPKVAAVSIVLFALFVAGALVGIGVQTLKGFPHYEPGKYLFWWLAPQSVDAILLAVMAVFLQAISPNKYVGWLLMVLVLISQVVLSKIGWEHNLYIYGGAPTTPLSDLNGLGLSGRAAWTFRAYWSLIALALGTIAYALWRRGADSRLRPRLARLPHTLASPAGAILALALLGAGGLGAWIYDNTNVINTYRTSLGDDRWLADYEKLFLPYQRLPQPTITDVALTADIHPRELYVLVSGRYLLKNETGAPISQVHVRFRREAEVRSMTLEGGHLAKSWPRYNYSIFQLDRPMAPGEQRTLTFVVWRGQRGFQNASNIGSRVYPNATFFDNSDVTPEIGMWNDELLRDRAKRRKYHLPQDLRPPKLEDDSGRAVSEFRHDSNFVATDVTVTTDADQTPIAPGRLISDRTAGGRRTSRFRSDAPIMNFFSIQSGRFAVRRRMHDGIALAVYYDPAHAWNVERMLNAMSSALDYDQANFGPYQFHQARILEFPAYATFAQSFANTIPFSEGIGFGFDSRPFEHHQPSDKIDMVTYVTAHEIGHQWWGHQIVPPDMQGASMLVESLAQYSALMDMEHIYGRDQIRRFLKHELDTYLRARGSEAVEEVPLERVENQPYIHYQKGSLVFYRLKDEIGEVAVNRALRRLLAEHGLKGPPYAASKDLVALLRQEAPADKQQLITDLFERITLYDLQGKTLSARRRPDGRWDVDLKISAAKTYADGHGRQSPAPLAEEMDVGLFTTKPGDESFTSRDVVLMTKLPIRSGEQTFHFVTDRKPAWGGIDPYATVIDRNADDNLVKVG